MSAPQSLGETGFSLESFLQQTLHTLKLDFTQRQLQQLLDYAALLQRWNRVFNLTAVRQPEDVARLHLADCLAALPSIQHLAPQRLLDVGSGGGLPGVVWAIGLPETEIHLVDTVQKKCAFLQQTCGSLRLSHVTVHHARVETLADARGFDCITSRAFSDLALLVRSTRHLLAPGGQWCAMKGRTPHEEIAVLPADVAARIEPLLVPGLDAQRCLVWMRIAAND
ncbi:MAG: 16S rRNA (guanine(527)-N(7))-methyltransferase RsmG [Thiomonas sp.]|uniref:16S rRNA (guanine(527)-N(7))-methyltransferase RsmG n=1 Tax=Thiomonas sp. TaxID=2047785 RepID=UPI002A36B424|nr:16S rRNA (guanine(527)-N(7))-methyltransferase RsmG [Thiomonas sp.]MDY0331247.1 16S rRNA (guanine(527)-N(7))-methyltransferase RsmG [Thiomonas sp.]